MKNLMHRAFATTAAVIVFAGPAWSASKVDPKASELLKKMSDYLASKPQLAFRVDGNTEVVTDAGEKLQFDYASDIKMKRPNKMRSDRLGEMTDLEFYYDGATFTLFGKKNMYFSTAPAPATIDQAIDLAREKLDLEAPAADLLYKNSYAELTEDVVSGQYIGPAFIRGVPCHHLAFRGNESDWQIWIEEGPKPLPHKFVITSKKVAGTPQFVAEMSQWNVDPKLSDSVFHFIPPAGAKRIEFLQAAPGRPEQRGSSK